MSSQTLKNFINANTVPNDEIVVDNNTTTTDTKTDTQKEG